MIAKLIEKLERVANDPRVDAETRAAARRDADGYRVALSSKSPR